MRMEPPLISQKHEEHHQKHTWSDFRGLLDRNSRCKRKYPQCWPHSEVTKYFEQSAVMADVTPSNRAVRLQLAYSDRKELGGARPTSNTTKGEVHLLLGES